MSPTAISSVPKPRASKIKATAETGTYKGSRYCSAVALLEYASGRDEPEGVRCETVVILGAQLLGGTSHVLQKVELLLIAGVIVQTMLKLHVKTLMDALL